MRRAWGWFNDRGSAFVCLKPADDKIVGATSNKENLERSMPDIAQTGACWFRGRDRGSTMSGCCFRLLF